jgi:hypothetical protein
MLLNDLHALPWPLLSKVFSSGFVFGMVFALLFFAPSASSARKE